MSESVFIYKLPLYIIALLCIVGWALLFSVIFFS